MKKALVLMLLVITVVSLSACGAFDQEEPQNQDSPEVTQEEQIENETPQEDESSINQAIGTYIGQIDSNSVEINVGNNPMAFVITDVENEINNLDENDEVRIEYTENEHGQFILKSVEKVN